MVLSAALLAKYGNIRKDICYPIQKINQVRMLSNGENISVIPTEKKLQIMV
jgi:tRNA(Ser,Leu) C12 N-acetylase TAN1